MATTEWSRDGFVISTDPARLDREAIVDALSKTYWARALPRETLLRSIENALPFGLYDADGRQVGYARVVTDHVRFAWLSDVIIWPELRGRGLGAWLVGTVMAHEPLRDVFRWVLATSDAHGLYRRFGFTALPEPGRFMIRQRP